MVRTPEYPLDKNPRPDKVAHAAPKVLLHVAFNPPTLVAILLITGRAALCRNSFSPGRREESLTVAGNSCFTSASKPANQQFTWKKP